MTQAESPPCFPDTWLIEQGSIQLTATPGEGALVIGTRAYPRATTDLPRTGIKRGRDGCPIRSLDGQCRTAKGASKRECLLVINTVGSARHLIAGVHVKGEQALVIAHVVACVPILGRG